MAILEWMYSIPSTPKFHQKHFPNYLSFHVTHYMASNKTLKYVSDHVIYFSRTNYGPNELHELHKSGNHFSGRHATHDMIKIIPENNFPSCKCWVRMRDTKDNSRQGPVKENRIFPVFFCHTGANTTFVHLWHGHAAEPTCATYEVCRCGISTATGLGLWNWVCAQKSGGSLLSQDQRCAC